MPGRLAGLREGGLWWGGGGSEGDMSGVLFIEPCARVCWYDCFGLFFYVTSVVVVFLTII